MELGWLTKVPAMTSSRRREYTPNGQPNSNRAMKWHDAHRFFVEKGWPVIDVTRRSIEETAAAILGLLEHRKMAPGDAPKRT